MINNKYRLYFYYWVKFVIDTLIAVSTLSTTTATTSALSLTSSTTGLLRTSPWRLAIIQYLPLLVQIKWFTSIVRTRGLHQSARFAHNGSIHHTRNFSRLKLVLCIFRLDKRKINILTHDQILVLHIGDVDGGVVDKNITRWLGIFSTNGDKSKSCLVVEPLYHSCNALVGGAHVIDHVYSIIAAIFYIISLYL